ncbi:MAG: hypothetical protein ACE5ID_03145 [Acidobacteriota bacterium]
MRNVEPRRYESYLTNIPPESWSAEALARRYGCRWQIELLFTAILDVLLTPAHLSRALACRFEHMLLHEAVDPYRSRHLLLDRV